MAATAMTNLKRFHRRTPSVGDTTSGIRTHMLLRPRHHLTMTPHASISGRRPRAASLRLRDMDSLARSLAHLCLRGKTQAQQPWVRLPRPSVSYQPQTPRGSSFDESLRLPPLQTHCQARHHLRPAAVLQRRWAADTIIATAVPCSSFTNSSSNRSRVSGRARQKALRRWS